MQVSEVMVSFESRLWGLARDYHRLAQRRPGQLVDVARVVEMQEQVCGRRSADSCRGTGIAIDTI
jgi:hypothetical protein